MSLKEGQLEELRNNMDSLSSSDQKFAASLISSYDTKHFLSDKQWYWIGKLLERTGAMPSAAGSATKRNTDAIEEIFSGQILQALFVAASQSLKRPKLRYQTDGGSKVVFNYVADSASKWHNCTFIDNGRKAESKKRYGFIDRLGNGRINRDAPSEVKTLIRRIAEDPTAIAKLSGQKYSNCVFCGLELVNKSSVHHGYGPICASKWGLPWGDTGDLADEEAAAQAELKHHSAQERQDGEELMDFAVHPEHKQ